MGSPIQRSPDQSLFADSPKLIAGYHVFDPTYIVTGKQDADTWKVDTVYLGGDARDSSEKDPTIQALGMGGQIYGARADLIILDDCITTANAHEWDKQINWLQKEVITRLGKNGKLLIVGTRIAE